MDRTSLPTPVPGVDAIAAMWMRRDQRNLTLTWNVGLAFALKLGAKLRVQSLDSRKTAMTDQDNEGKIRVLIVDDEPSYRDYLERFLTREGYDVRTASTGQEALAIGKDFLPQVILADWMLKDHIHGLQVAESLREIKPDLQILLMTGFPSSEIRKEADRAEVFRFLEKPFGLDEVSAAIAAATA
ncbi:MAG: response regulator [Myxococcales bacterium]|nr:response regulator [Myxococcales bacterium]